MNNIVKEDCLNILDKVDFQKLKNSSVLLAGSNGLLGRYIATTVYFANKLHDINCKLYCMSLHGPNHEIKELTDNDNNIVSVKADLSTPFQFDDKVDYIFHAACYGQTSAWMKDKLKTISLNVDATRTLLELAKKHDSKFLYFSTLDVYGNIPEDLVPVQESYTGNVSTTATRSAYGESKRLGETICTVYRNELGVNTYIARIFHTYGPGITIDDERVIGNFIRKALVDKHIRMLDQGNNVKTFGYVADTVYMLLRIILDGKSLVYNVGGITKLSIRELADIVSTFCGNVPVSIQENIAKLEHVIGSNPYVGGDISKFESEFGKVNHVDFKEAVRRTVEWNKSKFNL